MMLDLDPATMRRIQNEIDLGQASSPAEVINRALDIRHEQEFWSHLEKTELDAALDRSMEQIASGEGISAEELQQRLAGRRASHAG